MGRRTREAPTVEAIHYLTITYPREGPRVSQKYEVRLFLGVFQCYFCSNWLIGSRREFGLQTILDHEKPPRDRGKTMSEKKEKTIDQKSQIFLNLFLSIIDLSSTR